MKHKFLVFYLCYIIILLALVVWARAAPAVKIVTPNYATVLWTDPQGVRQSQASNMVSVVIVYKQPGKPAK